ncbi:MAG: XTP/dITP diphosphohydrolase [Parasphingorhabdus sp.]|jgi:XTP/dITP diphosphohydrolase
MSREVVLATGNAGKLREMQSMLEGSGITCRSQSEFDTPEANEDGLSFVENAIKKARNACKHTGLPAIADDSGLEILALNGAPGIYSARYAGEPSNAKDNWQLLLKNMQDIDDEHRRARFVCVMVFMRHAEDPVPVICTGTWEGTLLREPQGSNGFGYDPIFLSPEYGQSAAEIDRSEKNAISHRSKALCCLVEALQNG